MSSVFLQVKITFHKKAASWAGNSVITESTVSDLYADLPFHQTEYRKGEYSKSRFERIIFIAPSRTFLRKNAYWWPI